MANKKISELQSRTPALSDLMLVGDPSSGYSYKCTVTALATIIETDIADGYVTIGTTQTISGAKTFSNNLTLTSVANATTTQTKFLTLNGSNVVNYRTGAEVLADIGGASSSSISGTTNYVAKFTSSSAIGNSQIFDNGTSVGINTATPNEKLEVSGVVRVSRTTSASAYLNLTIENGVAGYDARGSIEQVFYTGALERMRIGLGGDITLSTIANATTDTDKFLVSDGGVIKYRTGAELLSDIGGASGSSISGTTNYIPKFTSSSAIGDSLLFETGNLIGFGTTSPQNYGNRTFTISASNTTGVSALVLTNSDNTRRGHLYADGTNNLITIGSATSTPLQFVIADSERMRLDASGNLGINTSSPAAKLDVQGSSSDQIRLRTAATEYYSIGRNASTGFLDFYGSQSGYVGYVWGGVNGERMRLDASGNLGLGVTPSAWGTGSSRRAIELPGGGNIWAQNFGGNNPSMQVYTNAYESATGPIYTNSAQASGYGQNAGTHFWLTAPSGTAGNAISFTQAMTLNASGRLLVGTTTDNTYSRLQVSGSAWIGTTKGTYFTDGATYSSIVGLNQAVSAYNGLELRASGTDGQLFLATSGNVGIATTSPNEKLTIFSSSAALTTYWGASGTSASEFAVGQGSDANAYLYQRGNTALIFGTNNSERMRITSGGELLINTTSDAGDYKLQVNGNVRSENSYSSSVSTNNTNIGTSTYLTDYNFIGSGAYWGIKTTTTGNNFAIDTYNGGTPKNVLTITQAGNTELGGSIKTAAPSGGTAVPWKLGDKLSTAVTLDTGNYIPVEVNGVTYYLALVTLN